MFSWPNAQAVGGAPIKNQEPASVTWANHPGDILHIQAGTALDFSGLRLTAQRAGDNGRIRIHATDPTKLAEANAPTVEVRMNVATWAPDITLNPLPASKDAITAGVKHLAKLGFNAIRIHGLELWLMAGTNSDYNFPAARLDLFDWFLHQCKENGLFWIINPRQDELYQAGPSRFSMPATAVKMKPRMYTQQNARDMWRKGFALLYNRTNRYTATNILQDPALYLIECFNEQTAQFVAGSTGAWPTVWSTRDSAQGTGALTWNEWLATPALSTYADIAAANAVWGTSYSSFSAVPAPNASQLPDINISATQFCIDVTLYTNYLEAQMADYYAGEMRYFNYRGLYVSAINFPNTTFLRNVSAKLTENSVVNLHNYTYLGATPAPGAVLPNGAANTGIWGYGSWPLTAGFYAGAAPAYIGEYGWPYWGFYRNQWPMLAAFARLQGVCGITCFYQGNFFAPDYNALADARTAALYPYVSHSDPVAGYAFVVSFFMFHLGYVTEATIVKTLILNDRYAGMSPRAPTRIIKAFYNLFRSTALISGLTKARLVWTSDTTDDSLSTTESFTSWAQYCANALAGSGGFPSPAISAGNLGYLSSQTNNGSITAVATTGVIGTVTATVTQPVITISAGNTLVDGDTINVLSMSGSVGTWPGTSLRGSPAVIKQSGVAGQVQLLSGCNLTGLSGVNFTAGTWCEDDNVIQSGTGELTISRRFKYVLGDTTRIKYLAVGVGATVPTITGISAVTIPDGGSFFVASRDGAAIASSARLLVGICGNTRNTGDTFSADGTTMLTVGGYPIQLEDITVSFTLTVANPGSWVLYRLGFDGARITRESAFSASVSAGTISLTLRTGSINAGTMFELVRS